MQNYLQEGAVFEYTIPSSTTIASGDLVKMGVVIGVAGKSGTETQVIPVQVEGVFTVPKATGAITVGAALYYDATNHNLTTTSSGNTLAGYAFAPAQSGDATVNVKLMF